MPKYIPVQREHIGNIPFSYFECSMWVSVAIYSSDLLYIAYKFFLI